MTLVANGGRIAEGTLRSVAKQAGAKDFDEFCQWIEDNCERHFDTCDIEHRRDGRRLFDQTFLYDGELLQLAPRSGTQALSGDDITVHGDGEQTRDFVSVDDVIRANLAAMETDQTGGADNIGTGESFSIRELAEVIQDLTDTDSDIIHTEPRDGDFDQSVADISKAQEHLNFNPNVSLWDGLKRTIEWWQSDAARTTRTQIQR